MKVALGLHYFELQDDLLVKGMVFLYPEFPGGKIELAGKIAIPRISWRGYQYDGKRWRQISIGRANKLATTAGLPIKK